MASGSVLRVAGGSATAAVGGREEEPLCVASEGLADAVLADGWEMLHDL